MGVTKERLGQISVPIYIIVALFGTSSWADLSGVWTQFPLLVHALPEYWDLPSYVVLLIQVGNLGLISYVVYCKLVKHNVQEWPVIYGIIGTGTVGCLLLAFFWDKTTVIAGEVHSTALFILVAIMSLVDCTSSVVYLTFMGRFKPSYMSGFYVGEGMSSLIPALLGIAQGSGRDPLCINTSSVVVNYTTGTNHTEYSIVPKFHPPHFSVRAFMLIMFGMMCLSGLSFGFLNHSIYAQSAKLSSPSSYTLEEMENNDNTQMGQQPCAIISITYQNQMDTTQEYGNAKCSDNTKSTATRKKVVKLNNMEFFAICFLPFWSSGCAYGIMPSIMPYSCLPHSNWAFAVAVWLYQISAPLGSVVALFVETTKIWMLTALSVVATLFVALHLYLAAMSPTPPLQYEAGGEPMVIVTSLLIALLFSYVRCCCAIAAQASNRSSALMWTGVATQIGIVIMTIAIFICLSVLKLFTDMPPCTSHDAIDM